MTGDAFGVFAEVSLEFGPEYAVGWKELRDVYRRVTKVNASDKDNIWGDLRRWLIKRDCAVAKKGARHHQIQVVTGCRLRTED